MTGPKSGEHPVWSKTKNDTRPKNGGISMQCTKCGSENAGNAIFCVNCGSQLLPEQTEQPPDMQDQPKQTEQQPGVTDQSSQQEQPQYQPSHNQPNQYGEPGQLKNTLFGNVFFNRNGRFEYLFLAAFLMQFSFVLNSIMLYLTKKPLPTFFSPVFSIISFLLFVFAVMAYFKKSSKDNTARIKGTFIQTILSSIVCIIFLVLVTLLFGLIYQQLYRFIPMLLQGDANSIIFIVIMVALALILTIITLSVTTLFVAVFEYNLNFNMLGRIYFSILGRFFTSFFRVFIYSVIFGVLLYVTNILSTWLLSLTEILTLHGFIKIFALYMFVALLYGYLFFVLINMSRKLLKRIDAGLRDKTSKAKGNSIPVFAVTVLLLTVVLVILVVPINRKTADSIVTEIRIHMQQSETYADLGLAERSIFEDGLAYSKLLALRGYLEGLSNIKEANPDMAARSLDDMRNAAFYSTKNRYLPFFYGKLYLLTQNYGGAVDQFKIASYFPSEIPESYLGLLEAYNAQGDKGNAASLFDVLTGKGIFYDYYSDMQKFSTNKIDKYIEDLKLIEETLGPRMLYKAIEKSKYLDYQAALNDLVELQKKYPDNAEISYFIAKTADQARSEQFNYGLVKTYAEAFDKQFDTSGNKDTEIKKKLFIAQMYIDSNNKEAAEQTLRELYGKYPEETDVSGQYASILNENKKPDDALKVLSAAISRDPNDYYAEYLSALSFLSKSDVVDSLDRMGKFQAIVEKNPDLVPALDEPLYSYSLKFSAIFSGDQVISEVEKIKSNTVLYNYLYAIKGWKEKNSDQSNEYIGKVIAANKNLGYAYYIRGVNYFEKTVRTGGTDFSQAAQNYLESLNILPNHVEGYFAIGHCYLKWGKNLEALRAFRKVVDLLPYQDHRTDRYGMTVHAQGMISQLNQYDTGEGE